MFVFAFVIEEVLEEGVVFGGTQHPLVLEKRSVEREEGAHGLNLKFERAVLTQTLSLCIAVSCMVQDSITDHIDTARENSSHLNFTFVWPSFLQRLLLDMLPTQGFKG